jgi:biopolymer transport protein ExbD
MIGRLSPPSEPVKPDVPITPFFGLVVALIVFAILLLESPFRFGAAHEVGFQIDHLGDAEEQVQPGAPPNGTIRIAVRVETDPKGIITKVTVRDLDVADAPKQLSSDLAELKQELSKLHEELAIRPIRLIFELDANLPYGRLVELLDLGTTAGFANMAPIMIPDNHGAAVEIERIPDNAIDQDRK